MFGAIDIKFDPFLSFFYYTGLSVKHFIILVDNSQNGVNTRRPLKKIVHFLVILDDILAESFMIKLRKPIHD